MPDLPTAADLIADRPRLRALCAEVMGWKWVPYRAGSVRGSWYKDRDPTGYGTYRHEIDYRPDERIEQAMELVSHLRDRPTTDGFIITIEAHCYHDFGGMYTVGWRRFGGMDHSERTGPKGLPLAICIATLRAVGACQ